MHTRTLQANNHWDWRYTDIWFHHAHFMYIQYALTSVPTPFMKILFSLHTITRTSLLQCYKHLGYIRSKEFIMYIQPTQHYLFLTIIRHEDKWRCPSNKKRTRIDTHTEKKTVTEINHISISNRMTPPDPSMH